MQTLVASSWTDFPATVCQSCVFLSNMASQTVLLLQEPPAVHLCAPDLKEQTIRMTQCLHLHVYKSL